MKVAELRARLVRPDAVVSVLLDCAEALETWRDAVCSTQDSDSDENVRGNTCYGDNHIETCPVEIARQGLIAADDQRKRLR